MILKFGGVCSICSKPIPAGAEARYNADTKQVQHWDCHESQPPDPADYEKAESLGFRDYDELMKSEEYEK